MRCGYCNGVMDRGDISSDPNRCICGRRAITRSPTTAYVLVHAEGCDGVGECDCKLGWLSAFQAVAVELERRVATVHERVACPYCLRAVGERCVSMRFKEPRPDVAHPHVERIRADGISLR